MSGAEIDLERQRILREDAAYAIGRADGRQEGTAERDQLTDQLTRALDLLAKLTLGFLAYHNEPDELAPYANWIESIEAAERATQAAHLLILEAVGQQSLLIPDPGANEEEPE